MTVTYFPTTLTTEELDVLTTYVRHEFSKSLLEDGFKLGMHPFRAYYCDGCNANVGQPCKSVRLRDYDFPHTIITGCEDEYFCRNRTINFDYHENEFRHLQGDQLRFVRAVREVERSKDKTNFARLRLVTCECGVATDYHPTARCDATQWVE